MPGCPNLGFALVDVRDVAAAHLAAMTVLQAAGQRFPCTVDFVWLKEIAQILNRHFTDRGYKIPTRSLPNLTLHSAAVCDKTLKLAVGSLGNRSDVSSDHTRQVLNGQPRTVEEMVVDMGESMIKYRVV